MSAPTDEKDLTEAFYNFDRDQDGLIAIDELRDLLLSDGLSMSATELDEMMKEANRGTHILYSWNMHLTPLFLLFYLSIFFFKYSHHSIIELQ